ncbi:MAG: hypothetical protein COV99_09185 [Bacteroidetes bacterium CG12_big_fil_rev_8_21_14_0_65_60_17]|nr:MAG: hypothetical protein COV99_09185 [Bacteroidetes bacterium CG12_big_fil_rev_8_21_14_0_65_60_17]
MNNRLDSLDALRGLTIAAMLLVNNPGSWSHIYWPLEHAAWNGWTLTDLVFPFFLFMVGMSMMFSFPKRMARGESRRALFGHVLRRAGALMLLGWWGASWSAIFFAGDADVGLSGLAFRSGYILLVLAALVLLVGTSRARVWWGVLAGGAVLFVVGFASMGIWDLVLSTDPLLRRLETLRIPGVLVRIAWCYVAASAIWFLTPQWKAIGAWITGMLLIYAVFMMYVPVPGFGMPDLARAFPTAATPPGELFSNWAFYIDYHVFGEHTWSARQLFDADGRLIWSFDPEGLVSTVPATASVLFGVLAGLFIRRSDLDARDRLNGLFVSGCWLAVAGLVLSIWMPINKRLWTSSYTVFTAGMALLTLAVLYHAIDMQGWRRWARPLVAYGRNAIFAFVASGMMATALASIRVPVGGGAGSGNAGAGSTDVFFVSLKQFLYDALPGPPEFASFLFGILFVALWAAITMAMDRRRIWLKV